MVCNKFHSISSTQRFNSHKKWIGRTIESMHPLTSFDHKFTRWFQRWPKVLRPYMFGLTQLGSVGLVMTAAFITSFIAYFTQERQLAWAFAGIIAGEFICAGLKLVFNRVRPQTQFTGAMLLQTKSFPSGHACGSIMLYGLLVYLATTHLHINWNIAASLGFVALIILIGVSRIYLGAHYFLDVLGGWILGFIVLAITIQLTGV
jgi:membrane-associated phospholipid phosphatase